MPTPHESQDLSIAEAYERELVPALFADWPQHLLELAAPRPGQAVLDLACGTGVVARSAVAGGCRVHGIDARSDMIGVARALCPETDFQVADAHQLPFDERQFDVVICQFGLMFFADRAGAVRQARRVLRPGGRAVFAVWQGLERMPANSRFVALLDRLYGSAAADALRAPFSIESPAELESAFAGPEWSAVSVSERVGEAHFEDLASWVEADAKGWLGLGDEDCDRLVEAASIELAEFVGVDGRVRFPMPAWLVCATAEPSARQIAQAPH